MRPKVALYRGRDRFDSVLRALEGIADTLDLSGKRRILVKPNLVSVTNPLAATHPEAVAATVEFLKRHAPKEAEIVIAEGAAVGDAFEGFRNFGYLQVAREYGVKLVDLLKEDEFQEVTIFDRRWKPFRVRVYRRLFESDLRVSVARAKTHNCTIVTLSLKNMVMGGVAREDRGKVHQGHAAINVNLCRLAVAFPSHLSVVDGWEGMEGDDPTHGTPVDLRVAAASTDSVAADSVMAAVMGFNPEDVGYLQYCRMVGLGESDLSKVEVVGNIRIERARRPFKPHKTYRAQLEWRIPAPERFLQPAAL